MEVLVAINSAAVVLSGFTGCLGVLAGVATLASADPAELREIQEKREQLPNNGWTDQLTRAQFLRNEQLTWVRLARRWRERPYVRWVFVASLLLLAISGFCSEVVPRVFGPEFRY